MDSSYDGVYFHPTMDDGGLEMAFFKANTDLGEPVEGSAVGDIFHFAFFKFDEGGRPVFDETFEAVLGDPMKYLTGLVGSGLFGCLLRKTEKSHVWLQEYLKSANDKLLSYKENE